LVKRTEKRVFMNVVISDVSSNVMAKLCNDRSRKVTYTFVDAYHNICIDKKREFCGKTRFYEASVESIDLDNKQVVITHAIGRKTVQPIYMGSTCIKIRLLGYCVRK